MFNNPFYQQMFSQFGMQNELYPQMGFQPQQYNPQLMPYDMGTSSDALDSVFGMPPVGGTGVDFGRYQQNYGIDQSGTYDYYGGNQQSMNQQPMTQPMNGTGDYGGPQSYDSFGVYY